MVGSYRKEDIAQVFLPTGERLCLFTFRFDNTIPTCNETRNMEASNKNWQDRVGIIIGHPHREVAEQCEDVLTFTFEIIL